MQYVNIKKPLPFELESGCLVQLNLCYQLSLPKNLSR